MVAYPVIQVFIWKIQWNVLPTRSFLNRRIRTINSDCRWCGAASETIEHVFWECQLALWGWKLVGIWWSVPDLINRRGSFSLDSLLNAPHATNFFSIWRLVVTALLWSIWIGRNEYVFKGKRLKEYEFSEVFHYRVASWGKASGLMDYGYDPLWKANPKGAIAVHTHKLSTEFWRFKMQSFDYICAVDGAWGGNERGVIGGGMGGFIKNSQGRIKFLFSGPSPASNAEEAEVFGLIYILRKIISKNFHSKRVLICSDSTVVVNAFNSGFDMAYPLLIPNFSFQSFINTSIFIQFVPRNLNDTADLLAKKGIGRPNTVVYWT